MCFRFCFEVWTTTYLTGYSNTLQLYLLLIDMRFCSLVFFILMWLDFAILSEHFHLLPFWFFMSCLLQILRRCEGSVELVDVSDELPHLIRRPGLRKWKVSYHFHQINSLGIPFWSCTSFSVLLYAHAFHCVVDEETSLIYGISCLNKMCVFPRLSISIVDFIWYRVGVFFIFTLDQLTLCRFEK